MPVLNAFQFFRHVRFTYAWPGAWTWHPMLTLVLIDKIKIFVSLSYSKTAFGVFMLYGKKTMEH